MRKFTRASFLILAMCIFAACKPLPSAIFQSESCLPPCWNGITPGQTSLQDIDSKVKSIPVVDVKSIKTRSILQANDSLEFKFLPLLREDGGRIYSQDGVVQAISFSPKPGNLLLPEALQKWGLPDQYSSIYYSYVETPYLVTIIIYVKKSIILINIRDMRVDEVPKFDKDFRIESVWFTNPTSTNAPLENGLIDTLNRQDLLDSLKPWTGLGEIQYLTRNIWGVK
jgi:hypothetical protein